MIRIKLRTIFMVIALVVGIGLVINTYKNNTAKENPNPQTTQTTPPVAYDKKSSDRMLDLVNNRRPLTMADNNVKEKLKRLLQTPRKTDTYAIEYVSEPDEFMVEILTIDINKAKEDSVTWLKREGLSGEGVCHLPVVYYLNYQVAENLRDMDIQFNPLPPGC